MSVLLSDMFNSIYGRILLYNMSECCDTVDYSCRARVGPSPRRWSSTCHRVVVLPNSPRLDHKKWLFSATVWLTLRRLCATPLIRSTCPVPNTFGNDIPLRKMLRSLRICLSRGWGVVQEKKSREDCLSFRTRGGTRRGEALERYLVKSKTRQGGPLFLSFNSRSIFQEQEARASWDDRCYDLGGGLRAAGSFIWKATWRFRCLKCRKGSALRLFSLIGTSANRVYYGPSRFHSLWLGKRLNLAAMQEITSDYV